MSRKPLVHILWTITILFLSASVFAQGQGKPNANPCPTPVAPTGDTACFFGPGCLDTSFGTNGVRTFSLTVGAVVDSRLEAVEVQSDGKIVGVGQIHDSSTSTNDDFLIVRLNTDGSLDTSFGDVDPGNPLQRRGYKTDNFSTNQSYPGDVARSLLIQPDGKILVGGNTYPEGWIVARYNTDGTRDTTFGTNGAVKPGFGTWVNEFAMQSDGKILATGPSNPLFRVMRLNSNGTLDPTFGSGGAVSANPSTTSRGKGTALALAIQVVSGQERIVLGGAGYDATTKQQENNAKDKFALMRFLPSGAIDNSFGTAGRVMTAFFSVGDGIHSLATDSQNRIVAAGQVSNLGCTPGDAGFARYSVTGALDTSFSGDGKANIDIYNWANHVVDVEMQIVSDGMNSYEKIVGFGPTWPGSHFALVRLNSDGTLDSSFGPGTFGPGRVTLNVGESDSAQSAAIQADNRIIVAGNSNPLNNMSFARYLP